MPRHTGYSPTWTRRLLERAGKEVLRTRLARGSLVSLPVNEVLRRANALLIEEDPAADFRLTTGAVRTAFGGKEAMQDAILGSILGPEYGGLDLADVAASTPGRELMDALAATDHTNQTEVNRVLMQTWLLAIVEGSAQEGDEARSSRLADVTQQVYANFDEQLIPTYARAAEAEGRILQEGVTWRDIAVAMTAVAEGVALRHLGDASARGDTSAWAVTFRRILWEGLTREGPPSGAVE